MFRWIQKLLLSSPEPVEHPVFNEHRITIRRLVSTWSDQKLHEVYAFCEDGKMDFFRSCQCLRGVATSAVLHLNSGCHGMQHYVTSDKLILQAEEAYFILGLGIIYMIEHRVRIQPWGGGVMIRLSDPITDASLALQQSRRDQELLTILRSEMEARSANARRSQPVHQLRGEREQKSTLGLKEKSLS